MSQSLPPGQGPVDPRGAFSPPPGGPGRPWTPPPPMAPGPGPMMFPYPPMMPQLPRRRGPWIYIFFVLVILALFVSVLVNVVLVSGSDSSSIYVRQKTLVAGDIHNKVAVVPVEGLIQDSSFETFDILLNEVERDSSAKALVVEVNTPGGSASASDEMYHRLLRFKTAMSDAGRKIPVVIAMRGMATSGGYYVSCGGDYIFAEPGCLTGNIGVLFPRFNFYNLTSKYGIEETTIVATTQGHSYKNAGSSFQRSDPRDEAYLQGLVDGIFTQFKTVVQTGRGTKLNDAQGDIFSAKAFIAQDALARGLIDKIDYPDQAYAYAAAQAGLTGAAVVRYSPAPSLLLQLLGAKSNLPDSQAKFTSGDATIDGIHLDPKTLEEFLTARPLLLWRGN